jgi:mRNA interferase MazF
VRARTRSKSSREKVQAHRKRLRQQGLHPIQIWVPDMRSPAFVSEAHRQSLAVAKRLSCQARPGVYRRDLGLERGVKRGEIWTVAGGKDCAAKPRPVVILQDDGFDKTESITICAFTTDPTDAPLIRLLVEPSESNGLRAVCRLMVDKITTVPKARIGACVGRLEDEDMVRLNRAVMVFLGIAAPSEKERLKSRAQC